MRTRMLAAVLCIGLTTALIAGTALAKKDGDVPPGQPFQALQEQIDLNSEAIADLQAVTADLQTDLWALTDVVNDHEARIAGNEAQVADLQSRMAAAEADLDELAALVAANTTDIAAVQDEIAALSARIDANRDEMLALVAGLQASLDAQAAEIAALQAEIDQLRADVQAQLATLEAAILQVQADLQAQADLTAAELAGINFQITLMLADIAALQGALSTLQGDFNALSADFDATTAEIADINDAIAALDARVATLEAQVADLDSRVSALEVGDDVVFSEDFVGNQQASAAQIQAWADFRAQTVGPFASVSISSSNGGGVSCTVPSAATQICNRLSEAQLGEPIQTYACEGVNWRVGSCGAEIELNAGSGGVCRCDQAATVRPGLQADNPNWGGVGSDFGGSGGTCFAPSQTLTVICAR